VTEIREFSRVRGLVFVMERDRRGRMTAIGLRTKQGEEYLVAETPIADFLRDFMGNEVVASVEFVLDDLENPRIRVYGFEPTKEEARGSEKR